MTSGTNDSPQEAPDHALKSALVEYYRNSSIKSLRERYGFLLTADIPSVFGTYNHRVECSLCGEDLISTFAHRDTPWGRPEISERTHRANATRTIREKVVISSEGFKLFYPKCSKCSHVPNHQCDCKRCSEIKVGGQVELTSHSDQREYKPNLALLLNISPRDSTESK